MESDFHWKLLMSIGPALKKADFPSASSYLLTKFPGQGWSFVPIFFSSAEIFVWLELVHAITVFVKHFCICSVVSGSSTSLPSPSSQNLEWRDVIQMYHLVLSTPKFSLSAPWPVVGSCVNYHLTERSFSDEG